MGGSERLPCGYGVVPILYQKGTDTPKLMPSEDIRLAVGEPHGRNSNKPWFTKG